MLCSRASVRSSSRRAVSHPASPRPSGRQAERSKAKHIETARNDADRRTKTLFIGTKIKRICEIINIEIYFFGSYARNKTVNISIDYIEIAGLDIYYFRQPSSFVFPQ